VDVFDSLAVAVRDARETSVARANATKAFFKVFIVQSPSSMD
jgi:hypothetical protein